MQLKFIESFERQLTDMLAQAITREVIPQVQADTRVDTGELRKSTRVERDGNDLYLVQGGTDEVDYAVYIELRYGDFSSSVASIDWIFG